MNATPLQVSMRYYNKLQSSFLFSLKRYAYRVKLYCLYCAFRLQKAIFIPLKDIEVCFMIFNIKCSIWTLYRGHFASVSSIHA